MALALLTTAFSSARRREFIDYLAVAGNAAAAARAVGLSYSTVREHYLADEDFRRAWDDALALAGGALEAAVLQRAIQGTARKLYTAKGDPIKDPETGEHAVEVRYDSAREALLLKRFMREEYKDRSESTVHATVRRDEVDFEALSDKLNRALEDAALRAEGEAGGVRTVKPVALSPDEEALL